MNNNDTKLHGFDYSLLLAAVTDTINDFEELLTELDEKEEPDVQLHRTIKQEIVKYTNLSAKLTKLIEDDYPF